MGLLLGGLLLLVSFMIFVMGAPLIYYLKREKRWTETGQTLEAWYAG